MHCPLRSKDPPRIYQTLQVSGPLEINWDERPTRLVPKNLTTIRYAESLPSIGIPKNPEEVSITHLEEDA
jgi:hypothetical protein